MFSSDFISSVSKALEKAQNSRIQNMSVLDRMPETESFLSDKCRYFVAVLDAEDGIVDRGYIKRVWSEISAKAQCSIHNDGLLVGFLEPTPSGNGCYSEG